MSTFFAAARALDSPEITAYNVAMIKIKLRQLLWDRDVTATAVHNATGISQSILSDIVRGKRTNVGLDIINKLCVYLECDINDILEFEPE